ncbi:hypothetical protein ACVWZR_002099 [Bradyrhizobium sp. i1.3.1]
MLVDRVDTCVIRYRMGKIPLFCSRTNTWKALSNAGLKPRKAVTMALTSAGTKVERKRTDAATASPWTLRLRWRRRFRFGNG